MTNQNTQLVAVGLPAPDFALLDHSQHSVSLASFRGRPVVMFFFPGAFTPICTKESCTFRDHFGDFARLDAVILGISSDDHSKLARFATQFNLPFRLLSDPDAKVRSLYQVPKALGLLPGRSTFVIDARGVLRLAYHAQLRAAAHAARALEALNDLAR